MIDYPQLPYAGTSGWSGSDTSHSRAVTADHSGQTLDRQQTVIRLIRDSGSTGITWKDLSDLTGWHHGTASGALSVLHKVEKICRLSEKRNRCKIYVMPEYVNDRPTEPHRGSIRGTVGNLTQEKPMMTEEQAEALIAGHDVLVNRIQRNLGEWADSRETAEAVIATVADWLTQYRPENFGDDYCPPLDVTAFILRKGEQATR
jgi:hypothetical protein